MRLAVLLLWLFSAIVEVLALNVAAPWEMLYFYSAYKSEWLAGRSGAERKIATLCAHKDSSLSFGNTYAADVAAAGMAAGICTFDEFVKHVGEQQAYRNYYNTDKGSTINPDFDDMLEKFQTAAKGQPPRSPFAVDPSKLLPKFTFDDPARVPYPPIITAITNAMQDARTTSSASGKNTALIATEVALSKAYTQIVHELRNSDTETHKALALRPLLVGTPFNIVTLPTVRVYKPDGKVLAGAAYNHVVDMDGMFAASTSTQKQRNELTKAVAAARDIDVLLKEHTNVIDSFNDATAMLATDIGACNAVTKRDVQWSGDAVMGTSGLLELRDEGVEWKSDDPNQRHLKGLKIMFKAINAAAIGSMSRSLFV